MEKSAATSGDGELAFLSGGGEMGALMRAHDWSATALGPPQGWPQPLRTMIRVILNTGHPMYIWWGPELLCFYNDAYRQSIGPERHPGSLGRPASEVWDEIWSIIGPQIAQVMAGGGATWSVNALVPITRHGRREDVYWTYSYSPIDDASAPNGVGGVLVVCTETTATVLAERRRSEEAARQRRLFEQAPGFIIVMHGPDHVVEFVNDAHHKLFNSRSWIGTPIRQAFSAIEGQGYFESLDRVYATGEAHQEQAAEVRFPRAPGGPEQAHYLTFVYAPLIGEDGAVTGTFCNGFDVTDGHSARQAKLQLAAIVEFSEDAILTRDMDGRITSWNRGAQRLFGYAAEEMLGRPVTLLIPQGREEEEARELAHLRAGLAIAPYETVRRRKDGSLVDISLSVSPLRDHHGQVVGASKIARDITERKRAQAQERLLVREMHHRIKNLFAVAGGIVSLSARDAMSVVDLKQGVLERLKALARAHDLTLAPEAGAGAGTLPATLHALIGAIMAPYESPQAGGRRVLATGSDVAVSPAAATAFALLVHEFATNAAKYGALSTDAGTIEIQSTEEDGMLHLTWRERGGPSAPLAGMEEGFGSYLTKATIATLGGAIDRNWTEDGLLIRLTAPLARLRP